LRRCIATSPLAVALASGKIKKILVLPVEEIFESAKPDVPVVRN